MEPSSAQSLDEAIDEAADIYLDGLAQVLAREAAEAKKAAMTDGGTATPV